MPKSSWSGVLEFGLITVPVKLYRRTSPSSGVSFKQLNAETGNPVSHKKVDSITGKPVVELTKGYQLPDKSLVAMSLEEVKELLPERSSKLEMIGFVDVDSIEEERLDTSYSIVVDENFKRSYSLITQAMAKTGRAAVCKVVLSNKESLVLLKVQDSRMVARTLHWDDEIRENLSTHADEVSGEELDLAVRLVEKQSKEIDFSIIKETFKENVEALAQEKSANGGKVVTKLAKEKPENKELSLLAALQASIGE